MRRPTERPAFTAVFAVGILAACEPPPRSDLQAAACPNAPTGAVAFAPELADSGRVFRGQLNRDRTELLYFRKVSPDLQRGEDYRIVISRRDSATDSWSDPEAVRIGAPASDLYPALSPDGEILVFASYRRIPGDTSVHPNASLWRAHRTDSGWSEPRPIAAAVAHGSYHSGPAFGPGGRLYFSRTSPDWSAHEDLVMEFSQGSFGPPQPFDAVRRLPDLGPGLHLWGGSPGFDTTFVLLGVSTIDSTTRRPGPSDLWVTFRSADGGWTEPRPLGAGVNLPATYDNFPSFSADGCELIFVREFSRFYRVSLAAALQSARRP